ncbi:MAG TPA: response regulator [Candidatus Methanomethylophilaceae archaeon]|nr:response regulator [Candidatus Methanomethylophilaceae archaeon]
MKVLVVDDNIAIQEILREIITNSGHEAYSASSVSEAAETILDERPDLIFLDSYVEGESGLNIIDIVHEENVTLEMKVYVIKNSKEVIPKDEPFVLGVVDKPFKSAEIIDIINKTAGNSSDAEQIKHARRQKDKKELEEVSETVYSELESRIAHLIIEDVPERVYSFSRRFVADGHQIMVITTDKVKAVREKMENSKAEIIALSTHPRLDYKDIKKLGSLTKSINQFIKDNDRPVVVIDRLSTLIEKNGANRILTMMRQIIADNEDEATFVISVNGKALDKKGMEILGNVMEVHKFESTEDSK